LSSHILPLSSDIPTSTPGSTDNIAKLPDLLQQRPTGATPKAVLPICECGKHLAADVVAKAQAALSAAVLLRAMFDVGYFPPNTTPPGSRF
jgi:hypothetical protein